MGEVIHSGWMNKKGERNNRYKRRWFEIQRLGDYDRQRMGWLWKWLVS